MLHNGFGMGFGHYSNWLCGPGVFFPGPLGWVVTLLFWGLIIYLLVKLFRAIFPEEKRNSSTRLDTLKERYARGEINEDDGMTGSLK
jgi:putative membrane protein